MTAADLFHRISSLLEQTCVPYMLTGSFASSVYGMHRGSPNIDFIIAAEEAGVRRLFNHLAELDFYSDLNHGLDACRGGSIFNVVDHVTGLNINFIFLKSRPFSQEEFGRRKKTSAWEFPLYIATAEDLIISKLEWEKLGKSSRQIEDAVGVLKVCGEQLDIPYIKKWVTELGLLSQWNDARRLAQ
jgi:hypothetical protein